MESFQWNNCMRWTGTIERLINTGVRMFLWFNQSRAKLIRLLYQHVGWKRDRGRGLGGDCNEVTTSLSSSLQCSIYRFPENVPVWVFGFIAMVQCCWHTVIKVIRYMGRFFQQGVFRFWIVSLLFPGNGSQSTRLQHADLFGPTKQPHIF